MSLYDPLRWRPASCVQCRRRFGTLFSLHSHMAGRHGWRGLTVVNAVAIGRWFTLSPETLAEINATVAARRAAR